jgi:putative flippase GtrA
MNDATTPKSRAASRFGWFAAAGAAGFVVDAGILTALLRMTGWPLLLARACSFSAAVTVTWLLNRQLAFAGGSRFRARTEYAGYFVIQIAGAVINLGVFAACVWFAPRLIAWPIVPLAIGAAVAFLFNYFLTRSALYTSGSARSTPQD